MKTRSANVFLHELRVGKLREDEQGYVEFRFDSAYADLADRPVLGQWFEDHPRGVQRGDRPAVLPAFFENMIPEGDLGVLLRERLGIDDGDDLGLLMAVGRDLPGAVVIEEDSEQGEEMSRPPMTRDEHDTPELRFSLAGVQLKFSMVRQGERFCFPGGDSRGDWIAKIALAPFSEVCRNEYITMQWARRSGFDVPPCELRALRELVDVPHDGPQNSDVFVIKRFDRDGDQRIHQEDFQQVVGRRPHGKYDDVTYEQLVLLAMKIVGDDVFPEMVRRLAFIVASGNDDAHLKNWSVLYPDRLHARLTPLYDQVFTGQWPEFNKTLALKLGGTKSIASIDLARFRVLATRIDANPRECEEIVKQAVDMAAASWQLVRELPELSITYRERIHAHWKKVPLLAPHADRVR